jgi:hypothetical protein
MLYTAKLSLILIKATRGPLWIVYEDVEFVDKQLDLSFSYKSDLNHPSPTAFRRETSMVHGVLGLVQRNGIYLQSFEKCPKIWCPVSNLAY